ncbi:MAG: VanW family protein [Christensenellales bacterium]
MRLLPWLLILGVLAVGVTIGTSVLRERQIAEDIAPYEGIFADNIAIDGVDISGLSPQDAYNALYAVHQNRISSWSLALTYQGHTYTRLGYPSLGISVSADQINARLREAWDLTHTGDARTKQAAIQKQRTTPFTTYTTGSSMSDTELMRILQAIAQNLDAEPTDAKLIQFAPDLADPFIVQEALPGRKLNVENARDQIIASAASGTSGSYELQPESIAPLITSDQIRQNISLRASAVTAISSSSPDNRNNNIRVSLGRVNGLVLKSGEEFSFNGVAGKRTIENGYYEALEYASRELVTGIGGGVCQSSSTIYQAAVMSRLKITSRTTHSDPVNYTDPGLDATVYWSSGRQIDFKFRNSTNSDIYIAAHVRSDRANAKRLVCEVKIYGESLGEGVRYAMKPVQSETLYPTDEIIYQPDKSLQYVYYKDETKLISEGKEGVVIKTYLEKYIDGTLVERSADPITTDTYRPRQPVYWVGTMPRPK